jgi:hypothetical protein
MPEDVLGVPVDWNKIKQELETKETYVIGNLLQIDRSDPNRMTDIVWDGNEYKVPYFFLPLMSSKAKENGIGFGLDMSDDVNALCFRRQLNGSD